MHHSFEAENRQAAGHVALRMLAAYLWLHEQDPYHEPIAWLQQARWLINYVGLAAQAYPTAELCAQEGMPVAADPKSIGSRVQHKPDRLLGTPYTVGPPMDYVPTQGEMADARDRYNLANARKRIADLEAALVTLHAVRHYTCEDCWYSCPKSEDGCCNYEEQAKGTCTCGLDFRNAIIEQVMPQLKRSGK